MALAVFIVEGCFGVLYIVKLIFEIGQCGCLLFGDLIVRFVRYESLEGCLLILKKLSWF